MTNIAPFAISQLQTTPVIPDGRFLLPLCITEEELSYLLGAAAHYVNLTGGTEYSQLFALLDAIANIDNPYANDCLPTATDTQCTYFPSWYSGIEYLPYNPFSDADLPSGYNIAPFFRFKKINTIFPNFIDDWFQGLVENTTGYLEEDIFVSFFSLPTLTNPFNGLDYPTLKLTVQGTGYVRLRMLSVPFGGRALVSIGDPPNIGDIFNALWSPDDRIIELQRDIIAAVPETDLDVIEEIIFDEAGTHEIWVTFLPTLNDETPFFQFGGGFRGYEVCGALTVIDPITGLPLDLSNPFQDGVTILTPQEICDIVESCLPDYALIQSIQAGIAANTGLANAAQASANNALALANSNLQEITDESIRIDDNVTAIQSNKDAVIDHEARIDALETDATQQALTLGDHETRIDALENAPSGSTELTVETEPVRVQREIFTDAITSAVPEYSLVLPQTHDTIIIEPVFYTDSAQQMNIDMWANGDKDNTKHQRRLLGATSSNNIARIGLIPAIAAEGFIQPMVRIEIRNLLTNAKPLAIVEISSADNTNSSTGLAIQTVLWHYEDAVQLTSLLFEPQIGNIAPISSVKVYGIEQIDVVTAVEVDDPPPAQVPVSWDATIDLQALSSIPSFIAYPNFFRNSNTGTIQTTPTGPDFYGFITIDGGSVANWDNITIDYYHHNDNVSNQSELWLNAIGGGGTVLTVDLDDADPIGESYDFTSQQSDQLVLGVNMYGLGSQSFFALRKIKLSGLGAIPSNLAAYGQEYF